MPDVTEPPSPEPVKVLIVDDDALVRSALVLMLGGRTDLTIVGEAGDGEQGVIAAGDLRPDVVLMDIRMPGIDGIEATRRLVARPDAPRVIVLTTFDTDEHVFAAIAAGAEGFLVKDTSPSDLIDAIKTVASGESMLSPSVTTTLVAHLRGAAVAGARERGRRPAGVAHGPRAGGGDRDRPGLSNAHIAAELFMSVATVKAHVTRCSTSSAPPTESKSRSASTTPASSDRAWRETRALLVLRRRFGASREPRRSASPATRPVVRLVVGEGGLELRSKGFSTVRSDPGNDDLAGAIQTTVL